MSEFRVPAEVPRAPAHFVNRRAQLDLLNALPTHELAQPPSIVVLSGMDGIGKSGLSRYWSSQSGQRFPGGHLYIDFASYRAPDRTAAVGDAIADCLRSAGVGEQHIPATLAGRERLFRTWFAKDPVLVVIDDATEPAQVLPLVPNSPGSVVVVTSSDRLPELALDGARSVQVEPLSAADGIELLRHSCGADRVAAEPDSAGELVGFCAGLPIAVLIAAARLNGEPGLGIAEFVAELQDEDRRLEALAIGRGKRMSAVFENACARLGAAERRMYLRLAVLPGRDISLELAALAAETSPEQTRDLVNSLYQASLLERTPNGVFRFHDLVRLHAKARADLEEPHAERAVLDRVAQHFCRVATFADVAVMGPNRLRVADYQVVLADAEDPFAGSPAAAMDWYVANRANLLATLRAVAARGWHEPACRLGEVMIPLYLNRRYLTDWTEAAELMITSARAAGLPAHEARQRSLVSRAHTDLGDLERAGEELRVARELVEELDQGVRVHQILRASVWEFTGRYQDKVDPAEAERSYQVARELNLACAEHRGVALIDYFLGMNLHAQDRAAEALAHLEAALASLRAGDPRMAGRVLLAIAAVHASRGEPELAQAVLAESLTVFEGRKSAHYRAQALVALAKLAEETGDRAAARRYLTDALAIHEETGSPELPQLRTWLRELQD